MARPDDASNLQRKDTISSFEQFDNKLTLLKDRLLSTAEQVKQLPEEDRMVGFKIGHISDLFEADTFYGVEADLCQRLVDAYQSEDLDALRRMPYSGSRTREEKKRQMAKHVTSKESLDALVDDMLSTVYLNSLTGGEPTSSSETSFGNETTGYHVTYLGRGHRISSTISKVDSVLAQELDLLTKFIYHKQEEIRNEIKDDPRIVDKVRVLSEGNEEQKNQILDTYLELEITKKEEVVAIGLRFQKLYEMYDEFVKNVQN
jgi:hypothetical protein